MSTTPKHLKSKPKDDIFEFDISQFLKDVEALSLIEGEMERLEAVEKFLEKWPMVNE